MPTALSPRNMEEEQSLPKQRHLERAAITTVPQAFSLMYIPFLASLEVFFFLPPFFHLILFLPHCGPMT